MMTMISNDGWTESKYMYIVALKQNDNHKTGQIGR